MLIYKGLLYGLLVTLFYFCQQKKKEWQRQIAFEGSFMKYLSDMTAAYGKWRNIKDAKWEVLEQEGQLPKENLYVRVFDTICEIVQRDGDIYWNGKSVFVQNIRYMKDVIQEEKILHESRQYLFLGLDYLAVLPVFFLPMIEVWAGTITEELGVFYRGTYGMLLYSLTFLGTILIYLVILWLMLPNIGLGTDYRLEKWLLTKPFVERMVDRYINAHYSSCRKKNALLQELQGFGNIREYLVRRSLYGFLPEIFLQISKWKNRDRRRAEALWLQTIVLMLSKYQEITVEELLEQMEGFAHIYKRPLAEAVDSFSFARGETIEGLKEEIREEAMLHIFDMLLVCDELPVQEAAQTLEGERSYFLKASIEEQGRNQREYGALAKMLAYVPLFLVLLLGLVLPFVAVGLQELSMYQQSLINMM